MGTRKCRNLSRYGFNFEIQLRISLLFEKTNGFKYTLEGVYGVEAVAPTGNKLF